MEIDTKLIQEAIQNLTEAGVLRWYASTDCARADIFVLLNEDDTGKPFVSINSSGITEADADVDEEVGTTVCISYPVAPETYRFIAAKVPDLYTK